MNSDDRSGRFERELLPHLHAAYNLARWLAGNDHDAEDLVQDAYLRAFEHFDGFRGESARSWLLTIVRNVCYSWLSRRAGRKDVSEFDEEVHGIGGEDPECLLIREIESRQLRQALEKLPAEYREAIVLRELEDLSYKEIADIAGVPIGTVMSRLARARQKLQKSLAALENNEA